MQTVRQALAAAGAHHLAGDLARADECYRQILGDDPSCAEAWYLLGAVNQQRGRVAESVSLYLKALSRDPCRVEVLSNLGLALLSLRRAGEAEPHLRKAIRLRPDFAHAHNNLGSALEDKGDLEGAAACFRRALELMPDSVDAHNNLGNALRAQCDLEGAVHSYDRALRLKPDHAQVHLFRAMARLQMGDFERGWEEYEWRFKCKDFLLQPFRQPMWDGGPLYGRTLLLYADQGLGDTLQFIRYAPLVQRSCGQVFVTCQRSLARIVATCRGISKVIPEGAVLPEFDAFVPVMSLAHHLKTTLATIPAKVPYLVADGALVEFWREKLCVDGKVQIGVAWQGNPDNPRDHQRSFRLRQLEPLASLHGVRLYSLQKGRGSEQLADVEGRFGVTPLGGRLRDFMDTAAVMQNLDLVISPDTSLAHLAGALGVQVWVALPFAADWRWLTKREDSPWYPTMRLFRQQRWGDWDDVFVRMADQLPTLPRVRENTR
jgi:tetratricopeptide (TPR) repeat protein